jgi:hypothetical protein
LDHGKEQTPPIKLFVVFLTQYISLKQQTNTKARFY